MGRLSAKVTQTGIPDTVLLNHLATLDAVGVPLQQLLLQAERGRMAVPDLIRWTAGYLERGGHPHVDGDTAMLVFGCIRQWKDLLPLVRGQASTIWKAILLRDRLRAQHFAEALRDDDFGPTFRARVLRRLGIPGCLRGKSRVRVATADRLKRVMDWLGSGGALLSEEVELSGFQTTSSVWGPLHTTRLALLDGETPSIIEWWEGFTDPPHWHRTDSLRIWRVGGLQHLRGVTRGWVSLRDCPDLQALDGPARILEVIDCPNFQHAWLGAQTHQVSLRGCRSLRALQAWSDGFQDTSASGNEQVCELGELTIQECPSLRSLPARLRVLKHLRLIGVGPIRDWPWDFRVGEDVLVADCPGLESLPAMDIGGSLIVRGESGLRRLSERTVIGKNLDLRACSMLEGFPRGVRVAGNIYLPDHLNHRLRTAISRPPSTIEMPDAPPPDLYEQIRIVLMAKRFPILIPPHARIEAQADAEVRLSGFKEQLNRNPRFETNLLWAASEAWRELADEAWADTSQWISDADAGTGEELPWTWFLELIQGP